MWTANTIIQNSDQQWTTQEKQQAKAVVQRKQLLYSQITVTREAQQQLREAKMIAKKKGVSIR